MLSNSIYSSISESFVNIPDELKTLPNWVMYRIEPVPNRPKPTKVPYQTNGNKAKADDPSTWTMYPSCVCAFESGKFDGIGFQFTAPYTGIDLDECRDPESGEIQGWAQEIVAHLDSYTEVSPSGTGIHIIVKGSLPPGRRRSGQIEMYDSGRYFTMTGRHLEGTPNLSAERTEELAGIHASLFPPEPIRPKAAPSSASRKVTDHDIIRRASSASNGPQFDALWKGDFSGYDSQSEADQALCCHLAFWTDNDESRIDALFRQSGLYREKWERADYRRRTIEHAVAGTQTTYKGSAGSQQIPSTGPDDDSAKASAKQTLELLKTQTLQSFPCVEPVFLIDGLIVKNELHLITGMPGHGKSTLVFKWCVEMARAGNDVLYLDRDNPLHGARLRVERFGGANAMPPSLLYWGRWNKNAVGEYMEPPGFDSELLRDILKQLKNPVVVYDTLATFSTCDENDNAKMSAVFKYLSGLTILGATVIVIHHTDKYGKNNSRGAGAMEGAVDNLIKINANIEACKINFMEVIPIKSRLANGTTIVYKMEDGVPVRATATGDERLLGLVKQNPGLSKSKFEQLAVKEHGVRRSTVRNFMDKANMGGLLVYDKTGLHLKEPKHQDTTEADSDAATDSAASVESRGNRGEGRNHGGRG